MLCYCVAGAPAFLPYEDMPCNVRNPAPLRWWPPGGAKEPSHVAGLRCKRGGAAIATQSLPSNTSFEHAIRNLRLPHASSKFQTHGSGFHALMALVCPGWVGLGIRFARVEEVKVFPVCR